MSGITNPFATNYAKPWEMDAALAQIEHNKLVGQDLRSQIAEREANRTALGNLDFGDKPGARAPMPAAPTGTFEQQLGGAEGGTNPAAVNKQGYSGQFQFGAARLADLGLYKPAEGEDLKKNEWKGAFSIPGFSAATHEQFLASPAAQHAAFGQHVADIDKVISSTPGAERFDANGLRAVAHLGGNAGMQRFISSGGLYDPADVNGTHLSDYYKKFAQGGAPALQAAFGSPHGPGGPPAQGVAPQIPAVTPAPGASPYQTASLAPVAPPTGGGVAPTPAPDQQATVTAPVPAPAAPTSLAPQAPAAPPATPTTPTVPAPTPPPPTNNLGLTADDQLALKTMATSKGQTPATIAAAMTQMRAHNEALKAQYRTDLEQAGNTAYTRTHQAQVDAATAEERRQAALRQGLPPGWHIGPDGKPEQIPEVKAAEGAKGPFPGQAEPAQLRNTLLTADPKSPEFHAAWEAYANPHEANGVLVQGHNMEPFKLPLDADGNAVTTYAKPPMAIGPGDLTQLRKIETEAGSLTSALDEFAKVSRDAGIGERAKTVAGLSTDLRSAWTNAALMAKGEALFNLGVLSGPDMTVIRGALADPSTFFGASATQETIDKQVGRIKRLLQTRLDQARQSYAPGVSRGTPEAKPDAPATRPPLSSFGR